MSESGVELSPADITVAARQARVVELRFFGGLDIDTIAEALEVSPATMERDWTFARAFLLCEPGATR